MTAAELAQYGGLVLGAAALGLAVVAGRRGKRALRRARRAEAARAGLLVMRKRLAALEAERALERTGKAAAMRVEFTSQHGEDAFLWELFEGALSGTYVEAGAYDGKQFSVTYGFEAMGWTGVLVEPIPERFARCVEIRPGSQVCHAALSRPGCPASVELTVVEGDAESEMLSFVSSGNEAGRERLVRVAEKRGAVKRAVTVPMTTMDAVMRGTTPRIEAVDFAVIDVEGHEVELLEGFDLEKYRPRVMVVEDQPVRDKPTVSAYLAKRHYASAGRLGVSTVFVRSDERALLARARGLLSDGSWT